MPEGMGIILRTAGASRTKPEIKRDFEYLIRMWETVRDMTLKSQAPTLVYEEGSLIKRSLRDLYNKEIDEIQVAGEAGYQEARDFMKMLMPSNVRAVRQYRDGQPLFSRMGVESQLDAMFSPTVQLRSGGYIVINQTEALVSIDVNSGRSTREHHIEDTALKTNLEAAEEVARQLRLRDLAGLIVIDFIDMDEKRNNRSVERKLSRLPAAGPRAHPGRAHLAFRPAGNVAPAHPRQRAGKFDRALPAMRRQRPCPLGVVGGAAIAARPRGNPDEGRDPQSRGAHPDRRRALRPQPQARPSARSRKQLQGDAGGDRRSDRERPAVVHHRSRRAGAHAGSGQGAAGGAGRGLPAADRGSLSTRTRRSTSKPNRKSKPKRPKGWPRMPPAGEEAGGETEADGHRRKRRRRRRGRSGEPREGGCAARRERRCRALQPTRSRPTAPLPKKANPTRTKPTTSPARFAPIRRQTASGGPAAADAAADAAGAADRKTVWPDRSRTNSGRPRLRKQHHAVADFDGVAARALSRRRRSPNPWRQSPQSAARGRAASPEPARALHAPRQRPLRKPNAPPRGGVRPCAKR